MKKILLSILSLITLISCETTPTEGCTDPLAVNYNRHANIDNNTCEFTANIVFYLSQDVAGTLYNSGVNKLTFYINEYNIGSQYSDDDGIFVSGYLTDPPQCFDLNFTTGSFYWADSRFTDVDLKAIDESGEEWFSETTQLFANECLIVGITPEKLKVHQENN